MIQSNLSILRFGSSDLVQFPSGNSIPLALSKSKGETMQFASVTQLDGTRTMGEAPVFLPAD